MKAKIALICVLAMLVSCVAPIFVSAAEVPWQDGFKASGFNGASGSVRIENGITILGNNTQYMKTMRVPEKYVAKVTMRIAKYPSSGHQGFQIMNGTKRTGLYISANRLDPFADKGSAVTYNVGNDWHDYRFHVDGNSHKIYVDNQLVISGSTNTFGDAASAKFFSVGDGIVEVERFELQADPVAEETKTSGFLNAPIETEYAPEHTIDWSNPESYKDWTVTKSDKMTINEETGILTIDVANGIKRTDEIQYYQVERYAKVPTNYDLEFDLQMEKYGAGEFQFKATSDNYNTWYYLTTTRINRPTAYENRSGLHVNIGNDWHHWKLEVRGKFTTIYMDGKALETVEMYSAPGNRAILRFILATQQSDYKVNLGKIHYKPYFPEVELNSPGHQATYAEGADIVFNATPKTDVEYVDYYMNGVVVGRGYAPSYEYILKNAKVGTYNAAVGVGDKITDSAKKIFVEKAFVAELKLDKTTVKENESVTATIEYEALNDLVKPSKVEYFVDGKSAGVAATSPFAMSLNGFKIGATQVYARITNDNGAIFDTEAEIVSAYAEGIPTAKLAREYEIDYASDGKNGVIEIADGYYKLKMTHADNKITYETYDGAKEYALGGGEYKVAVVSGIADVYFNGQFAFSFLMPGANEKNVNYSGVTQFKVSGNGTKEVLIEKLWGGEQSYRENGFDLPRYYALEFDKTDASDEIIVLRDGQYEIVLDFKNGDINTFNQRYELGEAVPFTLAEKARPGYYKLMVYKGLCQLFINNKYVDSFAAEACIEPASIERTMTNPSASTIISLRADKDKFYHNDDFSGKTEQESLDYWLTDDATLKAEHINEGGNSHMKLSGTGTYLLNAQTDDTVTKWSAKISNTKNFYVTARFFRQWHNLKIGYDFEKGCWYTHAYSPDEWLVRDTRLDFKTGEAPAADKWHNFELDLFENVLVLKMDGQVVIETDEIDLPASGHIGFGIDGGYALIDNFEYTGRCAAYGSMIGTQAQNPMGTTDFVKLSDDSVVGVHWRGNTISYDNGKTWSARQSLGGEARFPEIMLTLNNGKIMKFVNIGGKFTACVSSDDGFNYETRGNFQDVREINRVVPLNSTAKQISTGRIFLCFDGAWSEEYSSNAIFYSDDEGWTWKESKSVMNGIPTVELDDFSTNKTGFNTQECMIEEMPDGTVRFFGRTSNGFVYYMDSKDGGENFGEYRPTQLLHPLCTYQIEQDPDNPETYYAITAYNAVNDSYYEAQYPRTRFALLVSYDAMKNWEFVATINETVEFPEETGCNHALRVYGDTIYVGWNTLWRSYTIIYAIDKNKIKPHKRFETIHEVVTNPTIGMGSMGDERIAEKAYLPKEKGIASVYGGYVEIDVKDGMYAPETMAKVFGATVSTDSNVTFRIGDGVVKFTEGVSGYEVNGETKTFSTVCMKNGYLDINACAEAFGKKIESTENAYVIDIK